MTLTEILQGYSPSGPDLKLIVLTLIMILSGFVSGVTGFGFSFIGAMALFLFEPKELIPLLLILSTVTQFASIWKLRDSMIPFRDWWKDGPLPFIVGGAIGVPFGLWVLYTLDPLALCEIVGFIIVAYAAYSFIAKPVYHPGALTKKARLLAGFLGGVIGGFTAAPGSVVVIWAGVSGISKQKQRAIVQPFIVCVQMFAIYEQLGKPGALSVPVFIYAMLLCLFVVPANQFGVSIFKKITDTSFNRIVRILLAGMGFGLIYKGFHVWGELFLSMHSRHPLFGLE
jgi:uncharacterized membrane protein YfcA